MDLAKLDVAWVTGNCHKWLCSPKGSAFLHIREDKKKETKPLTISHGHSADLSPQEKFRFEFDWQGTRDPTAILCIPKSIETLKSMVSGGFDEIIEHNNSLALKARNLLCESLGTDPPTPDSMISAMATIDLPGTCLLYTSPSPRDQRGSRMPSSA